MVSLTTVLHIFIQFAEGTEAIILQRFMLNISNTTKLLADWLQIQ